MYILRIECAYIHGKQKKRRQCHRYRQKPPSAAEICLPFLAELQIYESFETNLLKKNIPLVFAVSRRIRHSKII